MKVGVIGLGRFGYNVAVTLAARGIEVLAIDSNETIIASIRDSVSQAICVRIIDESSLRSIGMEEMDTVVVAMGEHFAQSILITALLKKRLRVPRIITRSINQIHREIVTLIGADDTIIPEEDIGIRLAEQLSSPFIKFFRITTSFSLSQLQAPESFLGNTLQNLALLKHYGVRCIGLKKNDDYIAIDSEYVLQKNDILLFAGSEKDLNKLMKL